MHNRSVSVGEMNVAEVATIGIARACKHMIWDECAKYAKELLPTFFVREWNLPVGSTTIDLMGYKANTAQGRNSGVLPSCSTASV